MLSVESNSHQPWKTPATFYNHLPGTEQIDVSELEMESTGSRVRTAKSEGGTVVSAYAELDADSTAENWKHDTRM